MPILKPLPLLLNDPLPHLPIFTLYSLCVAIPYRIQYFFINGLTGVSRSVQQSLMSFMELYLTQSILASPMDKVNNQLTEYKLSNVRISADASNVFIRIENED